jgi:ADP-ribose pyrophosphatase YjhB (NUDIX family)
MEENTNWGQSVTGIVIRQGKVLLARHTYGTGKGKLIVPGGYVKIGETPQDALKREFLEETGIVVEPKEIIAIRFNSHDWYIAFRAEYISGEAVSDHDENDEVLWMETGEALLRDDVPDLTKKLIQCALSESVGLVPLPYQGNPKNGKGYLYGIN